jgi:hypothetical protein
MILNDQHLFVYYDNLANLHNFYHDWKMVAADQVMRIFVMRIQVMRFIANGSSGEKICSRLLNLTIYSSIFALKERKNFFRY